MVSSREFENFVETHRNQLESSAVPQHFWNVLHRKLVNQEFDAGKVFTLVQLDYEDAVRGEYDLKFRVLITAESGIYSHNSEHIYLIDHAWTFKVDDAKTLLKQMEPLRKRMANIVGVDEELPEDEEVEEVFKRLWRYCNFYKIASTETVEEAFPIWYMMDELGSAIEHSDSPNFRLVPFIYLPEEITYSLLFPIKDSEHSEVVSRDFIENINDTEKRSVLLLPWVYNSFENVDFAHIKPTADYFLSGHVKESLPNLNNLQNLHKKTNYKVFTEYSLIKEHLKDERFEFVDDEEQADILWYTRHFKTFAELSETSEKFVNQFPFEYVLTIKDLLCIVSRRKNYSITENLEMTPKWLPITYNLLTELKQFVSYFQNRKKLQLDNHWIIKPFNLARSMDVHITDNLNYILRLPITGPKIAQKYISNPVLFYRDELSAKVKFDIRYVILLKSTKPLQAYAYKSFFLRFANKPFEMKDFQDYEKHFTVMNYRQSSTLKRMLCEEFKSVWPQQNPAHPWADVEKSIFDMLKEIFECAVAEEPPCGIAESPQSRALYAADIMLEWSEDGQIQPKILEINWTPDCKRACEYYPTFYDDIFKLFFFDEKNDDVFYSLF